MSIRNLGLVLRPRSVAVIGASERPGSLGAALMRNLIGGGFEGPVWPVNPRHTTVMGMPCLKRIADLPQAPDLAAVVTPPRMSVEVISQLGARGVKAAALVSGGHSPDQIRDMLEAARPNLLRIIGPDTLGVMVPGLNLNASVAHLMAQPGRIALVSQSGAIASTLIDWAEERGIGLSHLVSLGGMADVDAGDYLNLLAGDGGTRVILLYLESIPSARKFLSAARSAARLKPVIALKAGRSAEAARAAATHTGALSGSDVVAEAALRRAGVLRVRGLGEMFAAAETLARFRPLSQARVAIVTNSGGAGVLVVDRLRDGESDLALLAPETVARLDRALPSSWSRLNPVDIQGDATPARYRVALETVAADPGVDVVLAVNCPTGVTDSAEIAAELARMAQDGRIGGKPALACWLGGETARIARSVLRDAGVATYAEPALAAAAVEHLTEWGRAQAALLRVPDRRAEEAARDAPQDARARVGALFRKAASEGRNLLTAPEAAEALVAYGVPVAPTRVARTVDDVRAIAGEMLGDAGALALKVVSHDVTHKSDVGGVVLDLRSAEAARQAAVSMRQRVADARPGARIEGFALQPMIRRPLAQEVILGVGRDRDFGPVILFGAGGLAVDLLDDTAVALPPLDAGLADELIGRTRISRLLAGFRGRPAADMAALHAALIALSHMVEDLPALRSLDVNPLLADAAGVIALDARIEIEPADIDRSAPNPDLAIRPYPWAWKRQVALKDGVYEVRPILPVDATLYPDFFAKLDDEDIRMRFMAPRRHFPEEMGRQLTQLDYDRDMAFVALTPEGALAGVARVSCDPDHEVGEYALVVRSDLAGRGVGSALLTQLIEYARSDGLRRLEGMVLAENRPMRMLVSRYGFRFAPMLDEPGVVMSSLDLSK